MLAESTGLKINDEQELMECVKELAEIKKEYSRVKNALDEVEATGYGIIMPEIEDLKLEEPEIMKQGGALRGAASRLCTVNSPYEGRNHYRGKPDRRKRSSLRIW